MAKFPWMVVSHSSTLLPLNAFSAPSLPMDSTLGRSRVIGLQSMGFQAPIFTRKSLARLEARRRRRLYLSTLQPRKCGESWQVLTNGQKMMGHAHTVFPSPASASDLAACCTLVETKAKGRTTMPKAQLPVKKSSRCQMEVKDYDRPLA